ncbi:hypothetical protein E5H75_25590 [Escherichia coli]|nr:hypothetical protein [Escherichia coli]EFA4657145.1 hypothetical protein [Escherichia coli]EFA5337260.1 hypothetical protein [Escherichia coli]EFB3324265.1 hypothetical protein [Escherichia coli]EFB6153282.1 hypothetical protein [Escherichia coli]
MFTHSLVSTVADNFIFPFIQYRTTDTNTLGDFTGCYDGHYFCGAGGNRPDGSDEALTTRTAVVPPFWRFPNAIWIKSSLNVVYFPNSKRSPSPLPLDYKDDNYYCSHLCGNGIERNG